MPTPGSPLTYQYVSNCQIFQNIFKIFAGGGRKPAASQVAKRGWQMKKAFIYVATSWFIGGQDRRPAGRWRRWKKIKKTPGEIR
jgi:hypothetical protein